MCRVFLKACCKFPDSLRSNRNLQQNEKICVLTVSNGLQSHEKDKVVKPPPGQPEADLGNLVHPGARKKERRIGRGGVDEKWVRKYNGISVESLRLEWTVYYLG